MLVTPLQMALVAAGGREQRHDHEPHLVKKVTAPGGGTDRQGEAARAGGTR